jgi:hypothetical protein
MHTSGSCSTDAPTADGASATQAQSAKRASARIAVATRLRGVRLPSAITTWIGSLCSRSSLALT